MYLRHTEGRVYFDTIPNDSEMEEFKRFYFRDNGIATESATMLFRGIESTGVGNGREYFVRFEVIHLPRSAEISVSESWDEVRIPTPSYREALDAYQRRQSTVIWNSNKKTKEQQEAEKKRIDKKDEEYLKLGLPELERRYKVKLSKLPNKHFVKVAQTCDFCHKTTESIQRISEIKNTLTRVPNCDRLVCNTCHRNYELTTKEMGNRHYGFRGDLKFFKTPMDKQNTAIMGLEMEFEGNFYGWKELEDAHKGLAFYGYDSSVDGQNELSWNCGSYSWWKYISPLKEVCKAISENGGKAGPTAGIHIHVSMPGKDSRNIARVIMKHARSSAEMQILLKAISLRTNIEKFMRYCSFDSGTDSHHWAVAPGRRTDTCEFRIFSSSLDHDLIIKRIKFAKEMFNLVAENIPEKDWYKSFSKATKKHIKDCIEQQKKTRFITDQEALVLVNKLDG